MDYANHILALRASMDGTRMDEIAAFLAVVEMGSFTAAARVVGRDASIISRRISALETSLGARLLERSTRHVSPTGAGLRFYERMRAATAAMKEAEAEATGTSGSVTGKLRLALPAAFGRLWIAPMLPEFLAAHPEVAIEAEYADRYVDIVAEGFDVAIRLGELRDSRLVAKRIAGHQRLICAAPSYLAARGTPVTPDDLANHACLSFTRLASHPEWRFRKGKRISSVMVSGPLSTDDAQSLVTAAISGAGIVMCSDWLAASERAEGQLVSILTDWTVEGEGAIQIIRPSVRFTAGKTRSFVDWISERFRRPPWMLN
jgi:DNA-binding transcriptional LysR family regulator